MKIIHTNATKEEQEKDMPKLLAMYEAALKNEPTWAIFGGVLTIEGRTYQVA